MEAKAELLQDFPTAIAIYEPKGWSVFGGVENQMEMDTLLACEQDTEEEAWEEALAYYKDMCSHAGGQE